MSSWSTYDFNIYFLGRMAQVQFEADTERLIRDLIVYERGRGNSPPPENEQTKTMRSSADRVHTCSQNARMDQFIQILDQGQPLQEDTEKRLSEVFTNTINDGVINWGRIVTILVFAAKVAVLLSSRGANTEPVIRATKDFTQQRLKSWIVEHDGWVRICGSENKSLLFWVLF